MGKSIWTCDECENKAADMKSVVDSMSSIQSELSTLKKGQMKQQEDMAEQKEARAQVLEGLKAVEAVAKRMEKVEETQENHEQRLNGHDNAIATNTCRGEEGEGKIRKLEERMETMEKTGKKVDDAGEVRQFNAMVTEVREIEKRERNVVVFNVPERTEEEEEEGGGKLNAEKIEKIFKELSCDDIRPTKVVRIGKAGRHPRQILVILRSSEEVERIMKKCRDGPKLTNEVFITRDRTYRQRQEAKLFRMEKEEEEKTGISSQSGERGGARGRGRGRGGGGRGRGRGRGGRGVESGSRKRRNSGDAETPSDADDEAKRRRMGGGGGEAAAAATPTANRAKPTSEHSATPRTIPDCELGAVGGAESF